MSKQEDEIYFLEKEIKRLEGLNKVYSSEVTRWKRKYDELFNVVRRAFDGFPPDFTPIHKLIKEHERAVQAGTDGLDLVPEGDSAD